MYKLFQSCAPIGQNIIPMHPPPIILHHHQRWCLRHHFFFYCKPEASYITYPSYTKLSYTALFWNSLYMVCGFTGSVKYVMNQKCGQISPLHSFILSLKGFVESLFGTLVTSRLFCPIIKGVLSFHHFNTCSLVSTGC